MFLFPCQGGQGTIRIHFSEAIWVNRPTSNPFKLLKSTGTHDFKNQSRHRNPRSFPVSKDFILLGDLAKGCDSCMKRAAPAPLMSWKGAHPSLEQCECHRALQNSNTSGRSKPRRWQWWLQQTQNQGLPSPKDIHSSSNTLEQRHRSHYILEVGVF